MEDRIDKYITGKMSPEEVLQFRKDLNADEVLQREYELAKELADSIQRSAIKHNLKQIPIEVKHNAFSFRKILYSFGAAASIALFVSSGLHYIISDNLRDSSEIMFAQIDAPVSRSGNDIDKLFDEAYQNILNGKLDIAEKQLVKAKEMIVYESENKYEDSDQEEYQKTILDIQRQDIDWYRVLILMQKGKVAKSKSMLKRIYNENGIYAEQAHELLTTKYKL